MILSMSINNQESEGPKDPGKRLTLKRIGKAAAAFGIAYRASIKMIIGNIGHFFLGLFHL